MHNIEPALTQTTAVSPVPNVAAVVERHHVISVSSTPVSYSGVTFISGSMIHYNSPELRGVGRGRKGVQIVMYGRSCNAIDPRTLTMSERGGCPISGGGVSPGSVVKYAARNGGILTTFMLPKRAINTLLVPPYNWQT